MSRQAATPKRAGWPLLAVLIVLVAIAPIAGCGEQNDPSLPSAKQSQPKSSGGEKSIEEFGEEATGSERAAIERAFSQYLGALAEEEPHTACSYLAIAVQQSLRRLAVESLKSKSCAAILPALLSPSAPQVARQQSEGQVTKIRVEGDRGFVLFRAPGAKLYQMTMAREGGEWKVATLGSSVLVPEL